MVDFEYKEKYGVYDLKKLVKVLRGEGGCPWDREQTHESVRREMLEEAYEAVEAIDEGSIPHLREELGDVLLQVVFHAEMEEEQNSFTLDDVADETCRKLILRHPHVFGNKTVSGSDEALSNWDEIKRVEKNQPTVTSSLRAVAKSLPSTWRAEKIQKKAAKAGFECENIGDAMDKLEEEFLEVKEAENRDKLIEELGDMLFAAVNVARKLRVDPEDALNAASDKFINRFEKVENTLLRNGDKLEETSISELKRLWDKEKRL